jgi:hypothetical protein
MPYTLDQIREIRSKITPGEWKNVRGGGHPVGIICDINGEPWDITDDTQFLAAAPAIIDQLLEEVVWLKKLKDSTPNPSYSMEGARELFKQEREALKRKIFEIQINFLPPKDCSNIGEYISGYRSALSDILALFEE